jgi:uncharacterized Zn-binding protein involved in type VI secretion
MTVPAGRIGDRSSCAASSGGPAATGSANILINGRRALRVGDHGLELGCCGGARWEAEDGAPAVLFNGKLAHRVRDPGTHVGSHGALVEGAANVLIGDRAGKGKPSSPGVLVRLVWPDGSPLPDRPYRLFSADGKHERSGVLSDGWIDERHVPRGKYRVEVDGLVYPLRVA